MSAAISTLTLRQEADVVVARRRARQLGEQVGLDVQDQTRLATAVSEIARNALTHGKGGSVVFSIEGRSPAQMLTVTVRDSGPGIANLDDILEGRRPTVIGPGGAGLRGTRRLVDQFSIVSKPGDGTTVRFAKTIPAGKEIPAALMEGAVVAEIDPFAEIETQNRELLSSLSELRLRQEELGRLNIELEDTNRGVVALYAELDERAEKLRSASELKSRFLSNMSHEFRTPLNSILALARLLLDRTDGELSHEQERQVTYIVQSAENLTQLVNDLLDIAKVEAGKVELRPSSFTVTGLFGSLRGVLRPLLTNNFVELVFTDLSPPFELLTDEGKVSQILRNLVSNSIKFTERGEICLTARYDQTGDVISFSVSDTGIGIAEENQPLIFQEFAQVENALQSKVKGTGLGLPLSRRLAELLGGELTVQSSLGKGSKFTLSIPARLSNSTRAGAGRDRMKVLIIDDEEAARYLLKQLLVSARAVEIVEARDGQEGLMRAQEQTFDVIILDLRMPGVDGYAVLGQLAADPGLKHIPVLVCSSSVLGVDDYKKLSHATKLLSKAALSRDSLETALSAIPGLQVFSHG